MLGKVQRAVHADIHLGLLHEGVAYDPHLREVHRLATLAQDLALEEAQRREAPAGAAAVLILDGGRLNHFLIGEDVALGLLLRLLCYDHTG